MEITEEFKQKIWKEGKSAKIYPSDFIVIPVLDVIELIKKEFA